MQHYAIFFSRNRRWRSAYFAKGVKESLYRGGKIWTKLFLVDNYFNGGKKKKKEELTVQTEEANKSKGENHGSFGEPQLVL